MRSIGSHLLTLAVQCAGVSPQAGQIGMGNSMRKLFDSLFGNREMRVRVLVWLMLPGRDHGINR